MSNKGTPFGDYLSGKLKDPELACYFIDEALQENDSDYLKVILGDIVKAYGVGQVSEVSGINCQVIDEMLSKEGGLTHKDLVAILNALGMELTVRPKKP